MTPCTLDIQNQLLPSNVANQAHFCYFSKCYESQALYLPKIMRIYFFKSIIFSTQQAILQSTNVSCTISSGQSACAAACQPSDPQPSDLSSTQTFMQPWNLILATLLDIQLVLSLLKSNSIIYTKSTSPPPTILSFTLIFLHPIVGLGSAGRRWMCFTLLVIACTPGSKVQISAQILCYFSARLRRLKLIYTWSQLCWF